MDAGKAVTISSQFDSGNIECLSCDDPDNIKLNIAHDAGDEFYQWFYFRLTGVRGQKYTLHIDNAGSSSYPKGWEDYQVVASFNQSDWFRINTGYQNGVLSFSVTAESDVIWFAYFVPYTCLLYTSDAADE